MITFEEIQQKWQLQSVPAAREQETMQASVLKHLRVQQRKALWSNIGTTLSFIMVFLVIAKVYISFHKGHTLFFGGSLLFISLLLLAFLWVLWKGIAYKKNNLWLNSKEYLDHYLQKLYWRRKTITVYKWVYAVLLWGALMLYCFDVTGGGSLLLRIGAPLCMTLYIFGVMMITEKTKQKKQLAKLDQLIEDMRRLRAAL